MCKLMYIYIYMAAFFYVLGVNAPSHHLSPVDLVKCQLHKLEAKFNERADVAYRVLIV